LVDHPIHAVLVDLDDTVYPQQQWLSGAWDRVADVAEACGMPRAALRRALDDVCSEGSDRGHVIDRALERVGIADAPMPMFVAAFRQHEAPRLETYPGVREALDALRSRVRVALVTDGDPRIQRSKLRSLGLADAFDVVVISDEYGRARRKPDPYALLVASAKLRTDPDACVYIGDRPTKDVVAAHAAGMRSIRVRTGEYARDPDVPEPWLCAADLVQAARSIDALIPRAARGTPVRR
jgi:putative hydrolase of the HAD superfamily